MLKQLIVAIPALLLSTLAFSDTIYVTYLYAPNGPALKIPALKIPALKITYQTCSVYVYQGPGTGFCRIRSFPIESMTLKSGSRRSISAHLLFGPAGYNANIMILSAQTTDGKLSLSHNELTDCGYKVGPGNNLLKFTVKNIDKKPTLFCSAGGVNP